MIFSLAPTATTTFVFSPEMQALLASALTPDTQANYRARTRPKALVERERVRPSRHLRKAGKS